MFKNKSTLLFALIALTLTACGGGGGSTSNTTEGKAVDGYLSGATVLCDSNNNGTADAGEQTVLTDAQGKFVFSPGCMSTVVITGGTNVDTGLPFKGVLKGPASSTIFTPLTGLLTAGLSMKQINIAAGLSASTSLTHQDPASTDSNGSLTNQSLLQRTLAIQQVMQQSAGMIAAMGKDNTSETVQLIYVEVVKATADVISANTGKALIASGGTVNQDLVNAIVKQSITRVQASSDTALASVKTNMASYSPNSIAELIGPAIAGQAEVLATTAYTPSLAKSVQNSQTVTNAAEQLADILKTAYDSSVNLSSAAQKLREMVSAEIQSDQASQNTALSSFKQTILAQASLANLTLSDNIWSIITTHYNYFALEHDQVTIDGTVYSIHQLLSGQVVTSGEVTSIGTIGFTLQKYGTPIPIGSTVTTSIGYHIDDQNGDNSRRIDAILDKVNLTMDQNGTLTVVVPANATMYVYGRNANGVEANITLTNEEVNRLNIATNSSFTLNAARLMEILKAKYQEYGSQSSIFSGILESKGEFYFKFLITKVDIRKCTDETLSYAPYLTVTVPYTSLAPVSGFGFEGTITVK